MNIRKPAVAGKFYTGDANELREEIAQYFENVQAKTPTSNLMIAPHAGYVFSAQVAASALCRVDKRVNRVIIIGPSHHKRFEGLHISNYDFYETPFGKVKVDRDIANKLLDNPLCKSYNGVEEPEHCIEVMLPLLQVILGDDFTFLPIHTGNINIEDAAKLLLPFVDDNTVIIASTDLSHYKPQHDARETDDFSLHTIVSGDTEGFIDGCGETAVRIIMQIANALKLTADVLDARTSFETAPQYCDAKNVVGYAAIVFVKHDALQHDDDFSDDDKKCLLALSRDVLVNAVNGNEQDLQISKEKLTSQKLAQNFGCFVTLHLHGRLRGCIGNIEPLKPLYKSVIDNTINAAFHDPRFNVVTANELNDIEIEISILSRPQPLEYSSPEDLLSKLIPQIHGVILKFKSSRQSTFLPQVWEQLPNKTLFLEHLAMKAGMNKDDWKQAEVFVYQTIHFSE